MVQNICCFIGDFIFVCIFGCNNNFCRFFPNLFKNFIQSFIKKVIGIRAFLWIFFTVYCFFI